MFCRYHLMKWWLVRFLDRLFQVSTSTSNICRWNSKINSRGCKKNGQGSKVISKGRQMNSQFILICQKCTVKWNIQMRHNNEGHSDSTELLILRIMTGRCTLSSEEQRIHISTTPQHQIVIKDFHILMKDRRAHWIRTKGCMSEITVEKLLVHRAMDEKGHLVREGKQCMPRWRQGPPRPHHQQWVHLSIPAGANPLPECTFKQSITSQLLNLSSYSQTHRHWRTAGKRERERERESW